MSPESREPPRPTLSFLGLGQQPDFGDSSGLSQAAAEKALAGGDTPQLDQQSTAGGFTNKLKAGLMSPEFLSAATQALTKRDPSVVAPAGSLSRSPFTPTGNLFFQFQRRRR